MAGPAVRRLQRQLMTRADIDRDGDVEPWEIASWGVGVLVVLKLSVLGALLLFDLLDIYERVK